MHPCCAARCWRSPRSRSRSQAAAAAGFSVRREWTLPALDLTVVVLHVASGTARALKRLQGLDPGGAYDFNHVYSDSGSWDSVAARRAPAGADPPAARGRRLRGA